MKKLVFFLLLFAVTGCTTMHTSQHNGPLKINTEADLKADIAVGEKISGTCEISYLFGFLTILGAPTKFADGVGYGTDGSSLSRFYDEYAQIKSCAAYDAVSKSNSDVIIAPSYSIEDTKSIFTTTVNAKVFGCKG